MAATGSAKGRRFAAACGVLSRCVKAAEIRTTTAEARPVSTTVALPLMPGADVPVLQDEHPAAAHAQMTIFYAGRVLVLDEFPAGRAEELLRVAAAASGAARETGVAAAAGGGDLPMARKASLQRFMEKRKGRRAVPYSRPGGDACTSDLFALAL